MSLRRELVRAWALSWTQRRLLFEATLWLGLFRVTLLTVPFRRVAWAMRLIRSDTSEDSADVTGDLQDPDIEAIGRAVRTVAARTHWRSSCLVQSLAAHMMLRRRDVPSVVYLGVAKDSRGEFIAHSWLRSGQKILTGADGYQGFSPIAAYLRNPGGSL